MIGTDREPLRSQPLLAAEGTYHEILYSLRPAGADGFGPPERLGILDCAYVGRRDPGSHFGPEIALPADDTQTSRVHGVFVAERAPYLLLVYHDLGSKNQTFLANEPVTQCPVHAGTRLRLGKGPDRPEILIHDVDLVRPRPEDFWASSTQGLLRGDCAPLRRMFACLDALAREARSSPVVAIRGPDGGGKKSVAWELIRRWEGPTCDEVTYIDGRQLAADPDPLPLSRHLDSAATLVLDKVLRLSRRQQDELVQWVRERRSGRLLLLLRPDDPAGRAAQPSASELVRSLRTLPSLRLPSALTCGRDEVERFARHFLARYQSEAPTGCRYKVQDCRLATGAIEVLRAETWPGNWRQLQRVIELAALNVAIDGRELIEPHDLPLGSGDFVLPLDLLCELPLAAAEQVFRQTYLACKFRKWAGNLSWVAHEADFSKRGLLKAAREVGAHDGEQIVLPRYQPSRLVHPRRRREQVRLHVSLPSSAGWLALLRRDRGDVESARALLLELLHSHAATDIEEALARQLLLDRCDPAGLARSLARGPQRRSAATDR